MREGERKSERACEKERNVEQESDGTMRSERSGGRYKKEGEKKRREKRR